MSNSEHRQTFAPAPVSAGKARAFVAETLAGAGLDHLSYTAALLVSELVANAILHSGTPLEVVLRCGDDRVRIEVHDANPQLPVRKYYSNMSGTGRGLMLVERMAAGWGSERTAAGKVVWFELEGPSLPSFDIAGVEAI
ncbi:MAG TPA: ATP-binding protein [Acidimicrobiales bacterium]|nr:ATP-binding protein [Acidimicrobiales bacterium]